MSIVLRAIETELYSLLQCQLLSGEQYFLQSEDTAPETLRTVVGGEVSLHPYSMISAYSDVGSPLVFLNQGGLTVVKSTTPKIFLLKTVIDTEVPSYPLPLVESSEPAFIREVSDRIRLVATKKRLAELDDFPAVLKAFNKAVDDTTRQADSAIRLADGSLSFLLDNLKATSDDPHYAEIHKSTIEQMKHKLYSYEKLMVLIDNLVAQKSKVEQLTHNLQRKIKPITTIAEALPYIS